MSIQRFGVEGGSGTGGQHLPFARAVAADGWLYVSGQVAMENGEVIDGGIVAQSHKAIQNVLAILKEAGYGPEHVVRCGVWLDDARLPVLQQGLQGILRRQSAGTRLRGLQHGGGLQGRGGLRGLQALMPPGQGGAWRLVPRNQGKQGKKNNNNKVIKDLKI
jgi:hypothetical protein